MRSEPAGRIFDIKRFAVHDGPGVRTTVFFKGCPLRCRWCHNPESLSFRRELMVRPAKCIACGACVEACPTGARSAGPNGERVLDRTICRACGRCAEVCYAEALVMAGRDVTVAEVMTVVHQDEALYRESGGGVTLSGGEPLAQAAFAAALLESCRSAGYHTAVDTAGDVPWQTFERVLPHTDLILYDLKHMDPEKHRAWTGRSNVRILRNLRRLGGAGVPMEVRMPLIPTVNDSEETIENAAAFLKELPGLAAVRLLAYHSLAGSKYTSVGLDNTLPDAPSPDGELIAAAAARLERRGLRVIRPPSL